MHCAVGDIGYNYKVDKLTLSYVNVGEVYLDVFSVGVIIPKVRMTVVTDVKRKIVRAAVIVTVYLTETSASDIGRNV